MAKLALIYGIGMRVRPAAERGLRSSFDSISLYSPLATRHSPPQWTARVTMHLIEGREKEIENTFRQSIEAFFEMYPEI
jgi:hypothetical protein